MNTTKRYSAEFKERAVRLVETAQQDGTSEWAAMQSVCGKLGCTNETLRRWVRQHQRDHGKRDGLTTDERERRERLKRKTKSCAGPMRF